jgi:hypothetical protein
MGQEVGRGAGWLALEIETEIGWKTAQLWTTPSLHFSLPGRSGCASTGPFWESHELCREATGLGRPIINEP